MSGATLTAAHRSRPNLRALVGALGLLLLCPAALAQTGLPPGPRPVPVDLGVHLLDVPQIREIENTFSIEGYVTLGWRDTRLAFEPAAGEASARVYAGPEALNLLSQAWWPDPIAVNGLGSGDFQRVRIVIEPDGQVRYSASVSAAFKDDFDFRAFPFDRQQLSVVMQSYSWNAEEVALRVDEARTGLDASVKLPEWELLGMRTSIGRLTDPRDDMHYARFSLDIELERKSAYYFWKVILPLLLLVTLSWTVFWMSEESLARRTGVTLTTLLTVVAYQFIVSESLPRLAYLTLLDQLMLLSFASIAATAAVNWSVTPTQRGAPAAAIDRACRWLFPLGYTAGLVAVVTLGVGPGSP